MPGFIGKERHAIDDKGRLMIPARFRRLFFPPSAQGGMADAANVLCVMKAPDSSIELYEPEVWNSMRATIAALSDFNPDERLLKTLMYESLELVGLDRQGRIPLSREFLDHAGIRRDVVIIGSDTKIVVWEPERLAQVLAESKGRFGTLAGRYF